MPELDFKPISFEKFIEIMHRRWDAEQKITVECTHCGKITQLLVRPAKNSGEPAGHTSFQ